MLLPFPPSYSLTTSCHYDDVSNCLVKTAENDGENIRYTDYVYDGNGNTVAKLFSETATANAVKNMLGIAPAGTEYSELYEYDNFNRMVKAYANGKTARYAYNSEGLRISKSVDGKTTAFFYEYDKPVLELDGENNENARNMYGTSLISRNKMNYLYNGHGDTTAVINGNTVVTEYEYDAFGNGVNFADDDSNPFRYCGEYYDAETKLIYLKARYYNPSVGRFSAEDTYWNLCNLIYGDNAVEEKDESAEEDSFFEKPVHNPFGYCGEYKASSYVQTI